MRINQFLAKAGLGSRRSCEQLVLEGKVAVNGRVITSLAVSVTPADAVTVSHHKIEAARPIVLMLNKPKGVVCSTVAQDKRPTVFDLLPRKFPRLFHVGRLDADTEGLLILTNDGELAQKMAHPKFKLPKIYFARLNRPFDFQSAPQFLKGFRIESGFGKFDSIYRLSLKEVKVTLTQGLKRQIRFMFAKGGYEVKELKRVQIGELKLGGLKPGQWKFLSDKEVNLLHACRLK
ncbi:MAG: pseudouridine synthase [bacterium]